MLSRHIRWRVRTKNKGFQHSGERKIDVTKRSQRQKHNTNQRTAPSGTNEAKDVKKNSSGWVISSKWKKRGDLEGSKTSAWLKGEPIPLDWGRRGLVRRGTKKQKDPGNEGASKERLEDLGVLAARRL